jgi:hypothetical protein
MRPPETLAARRPGDSADGDAVLRASGVMGDKGTAVMMEATRS